MPSLKPCHHYVLERERLSTKPAVLHALHDAVKTGRIRESRHLTASPSLFQRLGFQRAREPPSPELLHCCTSLFLRITAPVHCRVSVLRIHVLVTVLRIHVLVTVPAAIAAYVCRGMSVRVPELEVDHRHVESGPRPIVKDTDSHFECPSEFVVVHSHYLEFSVLMR